MDKEAFLDNIATKLVNNIPLEPLEISTVISALRKYQKIEDIYYHQSGEALENSLRAVIEDERLL